jgi:ElaB/YqjD/DUF883 family membrane-anchored ribosome-binding protein
MNLKLSLFGSVALAVILASGCSKSDNAATTTTAPAQPAPQAEGLVQKATATAQAQTEVVRQKAAETLTNSQAQVDAAISKSQNLLTQAKGYIGQGKWSEALGVLNQLNGQTLTPEQQTLLQSLKDQAQKGAAASAQAGAANEAKKAAGNLIPGTK